MPAAAIYWISIIGRRNDLFAKAGEIADRISSRIYRVREKMLFFVIYSRHICNNKRVSFVLSPEVTRQLQQTTAERDWPGNPQLQPAGWGKIMLLRYALAMHYARGKTILDSCCGIGWGAFLLDAVALHTFAVDKDARSLSVAKNLWPSRNTDYVNASVLDLPFASGTFDLVTAMESIEHFPAQQINRYLSEVARVLKPGGILAGSSTFPETLAEAEAVCARNPYHLHINTRSEMIGRLTACDFEQIRIFSNRLFFFARKVGGHN